MNRRISIIVLCALVLSACASYLVYRAVETRAPVGKAPPSVEVVVAARDLVVGTLIGDGDLKTSAWFGPPPAGALGKPDVFLTRGVVSTIYEGELVTEHRLAPVGSGGGLAATIPPGMRACAVKVNEVVGVAGFVVPGMRVDVLITGIPPEANALDGPKVRTLLQNIQVLSAGVNFQQDKAGKPEQAQVVNLLVSPAQAEILTLASNETHIQLVLRNPMDTQVSALPGTVMSTLFGGPRAPGPARAAGLAVAPLAVHPAAPASPAFATPSLYSIEVSNGAVHAQPTFSRPGGDQ
jgi:pilus assembly protein CpaB